MKILKNSNGQIVTYNNDPIIAEHTGITPLAYTVTFMVDGAVKYIISVDAGCSINEPPAFSDVTRVWTGWWPTDSTIGNRVSFPYTPNDDVTIYGIFATTLAGQNWKFDAKSLPEINKVYKINYAFDIVVSGSSTTFVPNAFEILGITINFEESSGNANSLQPGMQSLFTSSRYTVRTMLREPYSGWHCLSLASTTTTRYLTFNIIDGEDVSNLELVTWFYTYCTRTA